MPRGIKQRKAIFFSKVLRRWAKRWLSSEEEEAEDDDDEELPYLNLGWISQKIPHVKHQIMSHDHMVSTEMRA